MKRRRGGATGSSLGSNSRENAPLSPADSDGRSPLPWRLYSLVRAIDKAGWRHLPDARPARRGRRSSRAPSVHTGRVKEGPPLDQENLAPRILVHQDVALHVRAYRRGGGASSERGFTRGSRD